MTGKWVVQATSRLQDIHKIGVVLLVIRSRIEIGHDTRVGVVKRSLGWRDAPAGSD
jgi:hypothetical protein